MNDVDESHVVDEATYSVTVPETVEMSGFMYVCDMHADMIVTWKNTVLVLAGIDYEQEHTDG